MSAEYNIIALGREDFVVPYGMAGLEYEVAEDQSRAEEIMSARGYGGVIYILEEDIVEDLSRIYEKKDANILMLKAWGESRISKKRIREASIKAMGVDLTGNSDSV